MKRVLFAVLVSFAVALFCACGGTDDPTSDAGVDVTRDAGDMMSAFGEACTQDSDCMSNTCRLFMMLGNVCTVLCTQPTECPSGSMGQKCNMMGFCRP